MAAPKVINMQGPMEGTVSSFQDTVQPSWFEQNISGPLKDLTINKYRFDRLQYPADLHGPSKGGHRVQFDFFDARSVSQQDLEEKVGTVIQKGAQAATGVAEGADALGDFYKQIQSGKIKPKDIPGLVTDKITGGITSAAQTASEGATKFRDFIKNTKDYKTSVSLYMPDTLVFNQAAEYGEISVLGAAGSVPGLKTISNAIQSLVVENQAVKLALNRAGYAFNPQAQAIFQGIHFRTFNMSFTFTPRMAQEANMVKQIIKAFRMYAAPTILEASAGFFYKPPGIINITFCNEGDTEHGFQNQNILQLADCVLTAVDVNYAPSGWSAHKDGHPIQTTIDLSFQEIELIDRNKISEGY